MVQPLISCSHQKCSGKTDGCRSAWRVGYPADTSSSRLATGVYPPLGTNVAAVVASCMTILEALLDAGSFRTFSRRLAARGFETIGTLSVARMFTTRTFVTRLSDIDSNQTFRASPPFVVTLALYNPSALELNPFLSIIFVLALCATQIFLVIVTEMVAEMIFASEWLSHSLAAPVVA